MVISLFIFFVFEISLTQAAEVNDSKPKVLIVNLSTDDTWKAATALRFVDSVLKEHIKVVLMLTAQAVRLADKNLPQDITALNDKSNLELLTEIVNMGGNVIVCPPCLGVAGITKEDLIKGCKMGSAKSIIPELFESNVRTLSW